MIAWTTLGEIVIEAIVDILMRSVVAVGRCSGRNGMLELAAGKPLRVFSMTILQSRLSRAPTQLWKLQIQGASVYYFMPYKQGTNISRISQEYLKAYPGDTTS